MIEKYASERFVHNFPFRVGLDDNPVRVSVKAYLPGAPFVEVILPESARRVGYIADGDSVVYTIDDTKRARFIIEEKNPVEVPGIIGGVNWLFQDDRHFVDVRAEVQNGDPGKIYLLVAEITTRQGVTLRSVEQLRIKLDTEV